MGSMDATSMSCGLTDRPDLTLDVYGGRKTTIYSINQYPLLSGALKQS